MKKIIIAFMAIFLLAIPVSAQTNTYEEKIAEFSEQNNIDFNSLKEYPFETLWDVAKNAVKDNAIKPIKVFCKISAILLLSSFLNFFVSDSSKEMIKLINVLCVLIVFCNIFDDFLHLTDMIINGLVDIKNFMVTFIPIFASISFAGGEFITSTVYTGFFLLSVIVTADFCIRYIVPSVKLFLALGITNSISDVLNLNAVCEFYSKTVKIIMTAVVSVLCFILSLQTTITQSQDSLALKTGKFLVTSTVPIIGSALQGAVGSVYASMGVLKGFFGILGIAIILNIFLPTLITLAVNWVGYYAMIALSNILENKSASDILSCFKNVIEVLMSMLVLFMILLIFSLTIMIKVTQGV